VAPKAETRPARRSRLGAATPRPSGASPEASFAPVPAPMATGCPPFVLEGMPEASRVCVLKERNDYGLCCLARVR
jgi:hypothetical protein